jgi:transcriptional regulator with XRE-family HTH domain
MKSISDTLRQAVKDSGLTVYRICKDTGLIQDSLRRFMRGETSLRLDLADKLAEYFGIECRPARRKER